MMKKTTLILAVLLWKPIFGQQPNILPGIAKLFDGFTDLVSGPCNVKPDGCLEFFEGWYMHNGTSGTSDCRTTCIRYPSVRPDLKCGICDSVVTTSTQPVTSVLTETAPFFSSVTMPLATSAPLAVAISASSSPTIFPSDFPSTSTSEIPSVSPTKSSTIITSPVSSNPTLSPVIVLPPTLAPLSAVPSQFPSQFEKLFDAIPSSEMSDDTLPVPLFERLEQSADMSHFPSSIPSDVESIVPSDFSTTSPDSASVS